MTCPRTISEEIAAYIADTETTKAVTLERSRGLIDTLLSCFPLPEPLSACSEMTVPQAVPARDGVREEEQHGHARFQAANVKTEVSLRCWMLWTERERETDI